MHLVDVACSGLAAKGMLRIAARQPVPESVATNMIRDLAAIEVKVEPLAEMFRYEYLMVSNDVSSQPLANMLDMGCSGGSVEAKILIRVAPLLGSTRQTVERNLRACYTHLVHLSAMPWNPVAWNEFDARFEGHSSIWSILKRRDPAGFVAATMVIPGMSNAAYKSVQRLFLLRGARVFLAVDLYNRKYGKLPAAAGDLLPEFLPEVPLDPFDGKPIRFKPGENGTWKVYSVGRNGVDDGGMGDSIQGEDIVLSPVEFRLRRP